MAQDSSTTEANLGTSIFKIWLIAVVARLLYAMVSPGFHARDDYFHVLEPALQWLDDPNWIWADSTTPGAGIRSFLLPKVVQGLLELCAALSPSNQLRVVGGFLALWSSLIVPLSMPLIARLCPQNRSNRLILAWLLALHPALIYGAPKLLIEMQCLPLLMASLSVLVLSRHHLTEAIAGVLFGFAVYIRYQAITTATFALIFIWLSPGKAAQKYISLLALIAGALAGLSLGGVYDLITDGRFLGPLIQNIQVNLEPSAELTRSSPLSYLGILVVLACPWVIPKIQWAKLRLSPTYWALIVGALSFIVVHSATPHKEERFLYPILPMLLLVLGPAWFALPSTSIKLRKSLVVFHLSLTVILFTVHPQIATRQALEGLRDTEASTLISLGPEIQSFFIRPLKADIARNRKFTPTWLNAVIKQKNDETFFILSYQAQTDAVERALTETQLKCNSPAVFEQNWADALAFKLNPRHNLRRSPIETRLCRR